MDKWEPNSQIIISTAGSWGVLDAEQQEWGEEHAINWKNVNEFSEKDA